MSVSMETVNGIALLALVIICISLGAIFNDFLEIIFPLYISLIFRRIVGIIALGGVAFLVLSVIIIKAEREEE